MQDLKDRDSISDQDRRSLEPVASYKHTLGLLAIFCAVFAIGFALQYGPAADHTEVAQPALGSQPIQRRIIPGFIESLLFDWGILYYVWSGVRSGGGSLLKLSGRHWSSVGDVLRDLAIAAPFWVLWEATAFAAFAVLARFFATPTGPHDETFPVRGLFEIGVWIAVSLSAGFCEELIFRGYLQRQFSALTGRLWLGILLQGLVFGLIHPRGWRAVAVISILGVLYGILAAWRKNLRPGILSHSWSDLWEGWLKFTFHLNL
ncbi:CPBP family intramembrane metalloprotease [Tunturibacter empetritectus]|uniref:CPBP family intramembrane metalloprotease n=1 Tax=Tunturiibacter empetritectus TaxID=3069691 RepID=A0AAU7ZI71_9BACT